MCSAAVGYTRPTKQRQSERRNSSSSSSRARTLEHSEHTHSRRLVCGVRTSQQAWVVSCGQLYVCGSFCGTLTGALVKLLWLINLSRCFFGLGGAKAGPPANYDAITSQAIAAVQAGLRKGEKAMEVEVSETCTTSNSICLLDGALT